MYVALCTCIAGISSSRSFKLIFFSPEDKADLQTSLLITQFRSKLQTLSFPSVKDRGQGVMEV